MKSLKEEELDQVPQLLSNFEAETAAQLFLRDVGRNFFKACPDLQVESCRGCELEAAKGLIGLEWSPVNKPDNQLVITLQNTGVLPRSAV